MRSDWTALADPSFDPANLIALLKSPDPKIRSLAIFALDRRHDPHVLPEIAALQSDQAPAYRCPLPVDQALFGDPHTWPSAPATVGNLAAEAIHPYLEESGYANFNDYWAHYKDRNFSVGWFVLKLQRDWDIFDLDRAHRGIDTVGTQSAIVALRREIAVLPAPDRQWTILCLGTISNGNPGVIYPYSEADVLQAASELGHTALISLLKGQIQSTDPALEAPTHPTHYEPYWGHLQRMQTFALLHAKDLLQASDADLLFSLSAPENAAKNAPGSGYRELWAIAAASVRPGAATTILDEAEKRWPQSPNIPLARWRIQGQASLPCVLRWFYQPAQWQNWPYRPQETLALAIQRTRPNQSYERLVRLILSSDRRLTIDGGAMHVFAGLAADWHSDFDSLFVDWIYAQPPDPHPELMTPPRGLFVHVSRVSRKLVLDDRFLKADAQLLYQIDQGFVGNSSATWNLNRSESDRLGTLIAKIDLQEPQNTPESDCQEIRRLLRKAVGGSAPSQ